MVRNKRIGRWLRKMRERRGYTQPELATAAGTHPGSVSRWERGTSHPTLDQFARLCRALRASADEGLEIRKPRKRAVPRITTPPPPPPDDTEHEQAAAS